MVVCISRGGYPPALHMAGLPQMLAPAQEFVALEVQFERPITNYPTLWQVL